MKDRRWSYRVIRRYVLYQVPGIVLLMLILYLLHRWAIIPLWLAWAALLLWVGKDVILFPFVWRAFDKYNREDRHPIIGTLGRAEERLTPAGYVRVRGELWKAEVVGGNRPVDKGENVRVRDVNGMVLMVEPAKEGEG